MNKSIIILTILFSLLSGCMSPEELTLKDFDDNQVSSNGSNLKPYVNFQTYNTVYDESIGTVTLSVSISQLPDEVIVVPFVFGGTAVNGSDYSNINPVTSYVVFDPNIPVFVQTITFDVTDDFVRESWENVSVLLQAPLGDALLGVQSIVNIQIADNDAFPIAEFDSTSSTIEESEGTANVVLNLTSPTDQDVIINYSVSGTASSSTDYNGIIAPSGSVVILAGQTTATMSVNIIDDGFNELEESLIITLDSISSNTLFGSQRVHTINIKDDEGEPLVQFLNTPSITISETSTVNVVTVSVTGNLESSIKVPIFYGGTATVGIDYTNPPIEVILPGGSNPTQSFIISIIDDLAFEGIGPFAEVIEMTLGNNSFATPQIPNDKFSIIINDNEAMPEANFSLTSSFQYEPSNESSNTFVRQVDINVSLNKPSDLPTTVSFNIDGLSTSTAGADHNLANGGIVIPAGYTSGLISFKVAHDNIFESTETVVVKLDGGNCSNCTVGATDTYTLSIYDNDLPPVVSFQLNSQRVSETFGASVEGFANVVVELSEVSERETVVFFDYISGTADLQDCDPSPLPSGQVVWSVNPTADGDICSAPSIDTIDNQITTWDYTDQNTWKFTIAAGQKQRQLIWPLKTDGIDEPDENLTLTIDEFLTTNATTLNNKTHSIIISDEDALPKAYFSVTASSLLEGDNAGDIAVSIAVELSGRSSQEIRVPIKSILGTASLTKDVTLPVLPYLWDSTLPNTWEVVFAPGSTIETIDLIIKGDEVYESDETLVFELGEISNAQKSVPFIHTLTITENDLQPLVGFKIANQSVLESNSFVEIEVQLVDALGAAQILDEDIQIPIELVNTAIKSTFDPLLTLGQIDPDATPNPGPLMVVNTPVASGGSGGDYLIPQIWTLDPVNPWFVNIPAGESTGAVVFTVINDSHYEQGEFVDLQLYYVDADPDNLDFKVDARLAGTSLPLTESPFLSETHTINIIDEDPTPTVRFSRLSSSKIENAAAGNQFEYIDVRLTGKSHEVVEVDFSVTGTATELLDFDVRDDMSCPEYDVATDLFDRLAPPLFDANPAPPGSLIPPVYSDNVLLTPAKGVIEDGAYKLTFPDGIDRACIVIEVYDEVPGFEIFETQEFVQLNLTNVTNGVISGNLNEYKLYIQDNEPPPRADFTNIEIIVDENLIDPSTTNTFAQIDVQLNGVISELPTYVRIGNVTGTGNRGDLNLSNVDYSFPAAWTEQNTDTWEIVIPVGASSASVSFEINNESVHEPEENIQLDIISVLNGDIAANNRMNVKILPNDIAPQIDFSFATNIISEAQSYKAITARLTEVSGYDIEVPIQIMNRAVVEYGPIGNQTRIVADIAGANGDGIPLTFANNTSNAGSVISGWNGTFPGNTVNLASELPVFSPFATPNPSALVAETVYLTRANEFDDFIIVQKKITIPAGEQLGVINVNVLNDTSFELNENILLEFGTSMDLTRVTPGTFVTQSLVTIMEDDAPPQVSFTTNAQTVDEPLIGKKQVTATVSLDTISHQDVVVDIISLSGTANSDQFDTGGCSTSIPNPAGTFVEPSGCQLAGETWLNLTNDFDHPSDLPGWLPTFPNTWQVQIPAGFTSVDIKFYLNEDVYYEIDETIELQLGNPSNAIIGVNPIHTINIIDVSGKPNVNFDTINSIASEPNPGPAPEPVTVNISMDKLSEYEVRVPILDFYGSGQYAATQGVDFSLPAGWTDYNQATKWYVNFLPGNQSQSITFDVLHDDLVEYSENVTIKLDIPVINGSIDGQLGQISNHSVTILADLNDGAGDVEVAFSQVQYGALESNEEIEVTMTLTQPTINDVYVTIDLVDATLNSLAEANCPNVIVSSPTVFGICPAVAGNNDVAVQYEDHNFFNNTYVIPAGETVASFFVPIFDEADYEKNEHMILRMKNPVNAVLNTITGITETALTIYNDDTQPFVEFRLAADSTTEFPGQDTDYFVEFIKSAETYQPITITMGAVSHEGKYLCSRDNEGMSGGNPLDPSMVCGWGLATSTDPDYDLDPAPADGNNWALAGGGTMTLNPGEMDVSKRIEIYGYRGGSHGRFFEIDEKITFTISSISNGIPGQNFQHVLTIEDSDPAPQVNFLSVSQLVNEPNTAGGGSGESFTVASPAAGAAPAPQKQLNPTAPNNGVNPPMLADGTMVIKAFLSSASEYEVKIPVQDITGTANFGGDFQLQSGWVPSFPDSWSFETQTANFDPLSTPTDIHDDANIGYFSIKITDDDEYETLEDIKFTMGQPYIFDFGNEYMVDVGSNDEATINIISLDTIPVVRFVNYNPGADGDVKTRDTVGVPPSLGGDYDSSQAVNEGQEGGEDVPVYVDFEVDRPSYQSIDINFVLNITDGTHSNALINSDYINLDYSFSVTLPPTEIAGAFDFDVIDDITTEEDQVIRINLQPSGQTQVAIENSSDPLLQHYQDGAGANKHIVTIEDDDDIKMALGVNHTCALISDRVKCWGYAVRGELGSSNKITQNSAVNAPFVDLGTDTASGDPLYVVKIVAGYQHTCALLEQSKQMKCWGNNEYAQAGQANSSDFDKFKWIGDVVGEMGNSLPFVNFGENWEVQDIAAGYYHTCALIRKKISPFTIEMKCFGKNSYGQLGIDDTTPMGINEEEWGENLPKVMLPATMKISNSVGYQALAIDSIHAGSYNSCIITKPLDKLGNKKGHLCWGKNNRHQTGNDQLQKAFIGPGHTTTGAAYYNMYGDYSAETIYIGHDDDFNSTTSYEPLSWGNNGVYWTQINPLGYFPIPNSYQSIEAIGDEPGEMSFFGRGYPQLFDKDPIDLKIGEEHICAVFSDDFACWGSGVDAAIGLAFTDVVKNNWEFDPDGAGVKISLSAAWSAWIYDQSPEYLIADMWASPPYAGGGAYVTSVDTGSNLTCVSYSDGTSECKGKNLSRGSRGVNSITANNNGNTYFTGLNPVLEVANVSKVYTGYDHNCVVRKSNQIQCWGRNEHGTLGIGTHSSIGSVDGIGSATQVYNEMDDTRVINYFENTQMTLCPPATPTAPKSTSACAP